MKKSTAVAIFKDIRNDEIEVEEKLIAIKEVIDMETRNCITKKDMLRALRWLVEEYI